MYAPHFAAALAIKGRAREAPLWAPLIGAFIPDLLWIALARIGIDLRRHRTSTTIGLIPSFLSQCWLRCFASAFLRRGKSVFVAIWLAVFSHFLLDFPLTEVYLGWDLLAWGSRPGWLGAINDLWLQLAVLLALLVFYAAGARRVRIQPTAAAASSALLIGIQLLALLPCISY